MMSLLLGMIRARRFQACAMMMLAATATIAAIAGPAYLRRIDARVVAHEFGQATPQQRSMLITAQINADAQAGSVDPTDLVAALLPVHGFTWVREIAWSVATTRASHATTALTGVMVDRQDVCAHITLVRGRCAMGAAEVMLPSALAAELSIVPGDTLPLAYMSVNPHTRTSVAAGVTVKVTVVGIYRPTAPGDVYWGAQDYFAPGRPQPLLSNDLTAEAMAPGVSELTVDAIADPSEFTGNLDGLRGQVGTITSLVARLNGGVSVKSDIPALIAQIQSNESDADQVVPIAAIPLVLLAWFVIFMAAAYAAAGRRPEFAVVALRGAPLLLRWWLAVGDSLLAILIGASVAYAIVSTWMPVSIVWPAIALGGSVAAALLAQVRSIASPVVLLLRQVTTVAGGATRFGRAAELLIVLLAIAVIVQLRTSSGDIAGITMLAPGLVVLGTAVVASLAVAPLARRLGRRALLRGRIATALAAYQLGRRPGAQRVFVLVAVAVGVLGFATAGRDAATTDRSNVALVTSGAPRVLTVHALTRQQLLSGVRAADPAGTWAMAVVSTPAAASEPASSGTVATGSASTGSASAESMPVIAVDSERLAAVATWLPAYGPLSAAEIAARLHPTGVPAAPVFYGSRITSTSTVTALDPQANLNLGLTVVPLDGSRPITLSGQIRNGTLVITGQVPCAGGCRFEGFALTRVNLTPFRFLITLGTIAADGSPIISGASTPWAASASTTLARAPDGLAATVTSVTDTATPYWWRPRVAPTPLPVAMTGSMRSGGSLSGLDSLPLAVVDAAAVDGLPQLGRRGALMDLEYADLSTMDAGAAVDPQVWLGPYAPKDAIARLGAHGIVATATSTLPGIRTDLNDQGAALALRFHVFAALLACALAFGALVLAAGVDRRPRAQELRALRVQGVPARTTARAASSGYLTIVLAAAVVGLGAAALAWWTTGEFMPIFTGTALWPAPRWPDITSVGWPWILVVAILCALAAAVGLNLRRAITQR